MSHPHFHWLLATHVCSRVSNQFTLADIIYRQVQPQKFCLMMLHGVKDGSMDYSLIHNNQVIALVCEGEEGAEP